jgi:hypothetical protein
LEPASVAWASEIKSENGLASARLRASTLGKIGDKSMNSNKNSLICQHKNKKQEKL